LGQIARASASVAIISVISATRVRDIGRFVFGHLSAKLGDVDDAIDTPFAKSNWRANLSTSRSRIFLL
jgi:hypothetical protein